MDDQERLEESKQDYQTMKNLMKQNKRLAEEKQELEERFLKIQKQNAVISIQLRDSQCLNKQHEDTLDAIHLLINQNFWNIDELKNGIALQIEKARQALQNNREG